jgi:hypothetical protein
VESCARSGNSDSAQNKEFARALYEAARTRHDFLSASREGQEGK